MPLERESTRLFREARRARRVLGGSAGETAAAKLGAAATSVAATETGGIRSYDERKAGEALRRQTAAFASGYRPSAPAATVAARPTATTPSPSTPPPTTTTATTPATTKPAVGADGVPELLRRTRSVTPATTTAPVSKIDGLPAEQVLSGASVGLSKADILRKAREESATNPSVTRQDVIDRMNAERRAKGFTDVEITGKELAAADIEQQTNVEAAASKQAQKFFNTMSGIETALRPDKEAEATRKAAEALRSELHQKEFDRMKSLRATPAAPVRPATREDLNASVQGPPRSAIRSFGGLPSYQQRMQEGMVTSADIGRGVETVMRGMQELPNRTNAWSNRVSKKLRRDLGIQ